VICLAVGLLYLGFLSSRYNFDGTVFALRVERALDLGDRNSLGELLHPRHLLYEPMGYLFCGLARALGLKFRTVFLLQVMDLCFGLAALALLHRLAFRLYRHRLLAGASTLVLAFAFGFWFFAIEAEVYVPGAFFLILAFHYLIGPTYPEPPARAWTTAALVLALLGALAVLNHVTLGLFLIPLGLEALLYLRRSRTSWTTGLLPALLFSIIALGLVGAAYLAASQIHPFARAWGLVQWFLGPANPNTPYGYQMNYWSVSLRAFPDFGRGWLHTFLAAPYPDPRHGIPLVLKISWLVIWGTVLGLYLRNCFRLFQKETRLHLLFLGWLIPYGLWTWLWQANNFELKIALLPPLLLWGGWVLAREQERSGKSWPAGLFAILAAILLLYNLTAAVLPGADAKNNSDLQAAQRITQLTEPDAVIFIAGSGPGYNLGKIYIPYFARREVKVMDWALGFAAEPFPAALESELGRLRGAGRPVYVLSELLQPGPPLEALGRHHRLQPEAIAQFFQDHRPRLVASLNSHLALFKLEP